MRACIIAAAILALVQPAFAAKAHKTGHRHHASHHHVGKHHAGKHRIARHHHRHRMRVYRGPVDEGSMPQSFARADSWQQNWGWTPQASPYAEPERRGRRVVRERDGALDAAIARHAAANGLPVELVHRVVIRESRYNPRARNGSNLGLMQIKHATARGVGYTGSAAGLLDAETNLTYAVRYLAGAYRAAGGNQSRAIAYYASGYHGRGVRQSRVARTHWQQWQEQPVSLR